MTVCFRKCEKKLSKCSKFFQILLGKLLKKVRERGVAVTADKTAIDVVGNAEERLGGTSINGGGKSRIAADTAAQRGAKGRVVDVFVFFKIRHKFFPLIIILYQPMRKGSAE